MLKTGKKYTVNAISAWAQKETKTVKNRPEAVQLNEKDMDDAAKSEKAAITQAGRETQVYLRGAGPLFRRDTTHIVALHEMKMVDQKAKEELDVNRGDEVCIPANVTFTIIPVTEFVYIA